MLTNLPRPLDTSHLPTYTFFPYNYMYSFYVTFYLTYTTVCMILYLAYDTVLSTNLQLDHWKYTQAESVNRYPTHLGVSRTEGLRFTVAN